MIGEHIAHYRVTAQLGAGGMGEVYRATDTKLNRDVALKVLPDAFASDAQRMARFQREAQVLASLNHPNIAAIYGLEESVAGGTPAVQVRALVMELVEGPTLSDRVATGAIPLEEALPIAKQIAEALEYAHERGIIHRDLKPANIKLTPDGKVKLLDFGLAKALSEESAPQEISNSPTLSMAATKAGIILGTAAYMSPEQAKGKAADRRADIWSFGCVLYEMLTGRQMFSGETVTDVMAAVVRAEPEWSALPEKTPRRVRELLRRCLQKDSRQRLQAIGDARIALEEAIAQPEEAQEEKNAGGTPALQAAEQPILRRALPFAAIGTLGIILGAVGWGTFSLGTASVTSTPIRFAITLPANEYFAGMEDTSSVLAISPDGTRLVFSARRDGVLQLFQRPLNQITAIPIAGTVGGRSPFFSPDGKWVAFVSDAGLKKVPLDGGSPISVSGLSWGGGIWSSDDTIYFTPSYARGLGKVSAAGGEVKMITEPDRSKGELGHWWPQLLPGEKALLFTAWNTPIAKARLKVLNLTTGQQKTVLEGGTFARYVSTGHLVFISEEGLMAAPFDVSRTETTGPPVRVLEEAFADKQDGFSLLSISTSGILAYIPKSTLYLPNELAWMDRKGNEQPIDLPKQRYEHPRLSPDGRRLAITLDTQGSQDVWVYDLDRGTMTRVVAGSTSEFNPVWMPDGKRIVYQVERPQYDIFIRAADGTGEGKPLVSSAFDKLASSISPDGKWLVYWENHPETNGDIWLLPLDVADGKARAYVNTPAMEQQATISPDGKWLAYQSNTSGREEVFVQAFPEPGQRFQISTEGGSAPVWSRNGRELYYRQGNAIMTVTVQLQPSFSVNKPAVLFRGDFEYMFPGPNYDVAVDGRFLMVRTPPETAPRTLVVVTNWFDELKRLVPVK